MIDVIKTVLAVIGGLTVASAVAMAIIIFKRYVGLIDRTHGYHSQIANTFVRYANKASFLQLASS